MLVAVPGGSCIDRYGQHRLGLFEVTRTQIKLYARELEALGLAPATIGRRLSTLAASTATPPKRASSSTRRPCTFGVLVWTTSPTPSASTATRIEGSATLLGRHRQQEFLGSRSKTVAWLAVPRLSALKIPCPQAENRSGAHPLHDPGSCIGDPPTRISMRREWR
jgi:hypothetical protein